MRSVFLACALVAATASCFAKAPVYTPGTGGSSSGGTTSDGGASGTGGKVSTGGTPSTGGTTSSGGSSQPPSSVDCTDTSSFSGLINQQYGGTYISVNNNASKNYYMQANWWGTPYSNQTETLNGLGFTMSNSSNAVTSVPNNPLGFPSIFIGSYSGNTTKGSNLPKQVSALTSVPTIFSTNADQKGNTSYNATYDVWFTQSSAGVSGSTPGTGGGYLMVWLFQPSDKRPRGIPKAYAHIINGVSGSWDVWYDNTNPPCVSYVSVDKLASLQFDLNDFIRDAVTNSYGITNSQYLSIVFAGFEVWGGGDGLQLKNFCANVK